MLYFLLHSLTMKTHTYITFIHIELFLPLLLWINFSYGQSGYPVPHKSSTHLFYIQHSDNHNTYVYDANMKNQVICKEDPLDIYRIVYTEGGKKKSLTTVQRTMAYGMEVKYVKNNLFEMFLAASRKIKFYLTLDSGGKPRVYVTVNNRKMYLDSMFIKLGKSLVTPKADYIMFYGTDFTTGKAVSEKVTKEHL